MKVCSECRSLGHVIKYKWYSNRGYTKMNKKNIFLHRFLLNSKLKEAELKYFGEVIAR